MRAVHTVAQIREAEAAALAELPEGALMQRAAAGLASAVGDFLGSLYGAHVLLLVGSGDNGGDALYAGARLARRGAAVEALLLGERAHGEGLQAFAGAGGRVVDLSDAGLRVLNRYRSRRPDVVVDGITGIGATAGLREEAALAFEALEGVPVVAVDLPSGVDADTGDTGLRHAEATLTVTFGTLKQALVVGRAAAVSGAVELVDIGLGAYLGTPALEVVTASDVASWVSEPARDVQKYARGVVGLRTGSLQYPGAAALAAAGASCGLAGMVRYVGEAAIAARLALQHPEIVGQGRVQAWVVGSGGGDSARLNLMEASLDGVPTVIDADALTHASTPVGFEAVLTPHAGELATLLEVPRSEIEAHPVRHAERAAMEYHAVVLLKGPRTVVAAPERITRVITNGTPWLATAGSGDVLAGLIGALLATDLNPFDAATAGAWLHAAAGQFASSGGRPIVATDIAAALPQVIASLIGG